MNNDDKRIMTGIASLDNVLGGFKPGTLNVIAGGPGSGKTSLAIDIAVNCAKEKKRVVFFSLEMFKSEVVQRILKYVNDSPIEPGELPIYICDETSISPTGILDKVNEFNKTNETGKADIIIVDYLELIVPSKSETMSRMGELEYITCALKSMAVELNISVVLTCQCGREILEIADPSLDEVCYRKPYLKQYADSIIYVYMWFFHYLRQGIRDAYFKVVKNVSGWTGTINVKFNTGCVVFLEMDNDDHGLHTYELSSSRLIDEKLFKRIDGTSSSKIDFACVDADHRWFITYDGIAPYSKDDFDTKKVLAISVLEKDHGWKLAGMYKHVISEDEQDREENNETRRKVREALKEHVRYLMDSREVWAELVWGSKLEKLFAKACTAQEIIDPDEIKDNKLYPQVDVNPYSEFHYACPYNPKGENTWRIAYGSIKWN